MACYDRKLRTKLFTKASQFFVKFLLNFVRLRDTRIPTNRYESSILRFLALRIESIKQIFWEKVFETNPWIESLRFGFASPQIWIHKDSGFANPYFLGYVSCYSTKDLWGFMKTGWIFCDSRFETNLFKSGFAIHDTIQILDSFRKAQIKLFWSLDSWSRYDTNPLIRKTNPRVHIPWYDSRNLKIWLV